jgi:hypothetical protein
MLGRGGGKRSRRPRRGSDRECIQEHCDGCCDRAMSRNNRELVTVSHLESSTHPFSSVGCALAAFGVPSITTLIQKIQKPPRAREGREGREGREDETTSADHPWLVGWVSSVVLMHRLCLLPPHAISHRRDSGYSTIAITD